MAQCKLTPREFISNVFSPQIASVCSAAADAVCQKNNLSFVELLQPFCKLSTEGHMKDPQGNNIVIKNLRVSIQDVNARPPEPNIARRMLNEVVSTANCERTTRISIGTTNIDIPVSVPWFEAWREMFLSVQFPSDHELIKHFLACMIVVSTSDVNPLEKIQAMGASLQQSIPGKLPKWFNNNTLRYYVLIHDTMQDDKNKSEIVFTEMKNIYGANNCFLLQMNSRPPGQTDGNTYLPDPWSQFLVKSSDMIGGSEQSSSPRTPADTGGVSAMPNKVIMETEKMSQAGTPVMPQNSTLPSPDVADNMSISSEVSDVNNVNQLEIGQEAVPVTVHPLSPVNTSMNLKHPTLNSPINANVWADSPSHLIAQHGSRLSTQDLDRLRTLITEFCLKSLFPYVEKQICVLNDLISNKKGVSRSLLSATKRWFGTSKPGAPGSAPSNAVIYTTESPELQLRRLGDICFMFGHYPLAYQAYHSAKRDFAADQAWLYYAGALEMAALSAFMQGEMNRKTIEYMDDAILAYLNSCKMPQFATRTTLLSAECLKGRGLYGDAAKQLIRMTSEDSDLRSALLLEQAAYCFIGPKMLRKYAFHAVLAGHRYSKAGQRKHSLRCYQQAFQVYRTKGWSLAEDHIHFTIGRQAASLKQVCDAVKAFEKLLNVSSKQPAPQQAAFLREFLHTHNLLLQENTTDQQELPILPLPLIDSNNIKVLLGPITKMNKIGIPASHVSFNSDESDDSKWSKMEEILLTEIQGASPMIFKPSIVLYSRKSDNTNKPKAIWNEPIHFCIELNNPLHIQLPLSEISLLWSFIVDGKIMCNEIKDENTSEFIETEVLDNVVLQPSSIANVVLSLVPKRKGELKILGLSFKLSNPSHEVIDTPVVNPSVFIAGKRLFSIQGPKLKNVKEKPGAKLYGIDYRLEINVVEQAPYMEIYFSKSLPDMLGGEIQRIDITLKNTGNAPLTNVYITSTNSKLYSLKNSVTITEEQTLKKVNKYVTKVPLPVEMNDVLNIGEIHNFPMWIQAPYEKGLHNLDLLFYYENVNAKSIPKYRLCRHTWKLTVIDSIQIGAIASNSTLLHKNFPTLNLIIDIKNSNKIHETLSNDITLTNVAFRSKKWSLLPSFTSSDIQIHPQEMYHLVLKLRKKYNDVKEFSEVSLSNNTPAICSVNAIPYLNFIYKKHISPLDTTEGLYEMQPYHSNQQDKQGNIYSSAITVNSTLVLRWQANIITNGSVLRNAVGQHHLDIELLNTIYRHPISIILPSSECNGRFKIFGPDRNVPDSTPLAIKNQISENECRKSAISFSLIHARQTTHNFCQNKLCIIPVTMYIQNHLQFEIDVKVNTIGTSSETHLSNIKTRLYLPQASTYYRYVCHSAIRCKIDALARHAVKLQAMLSAAGTYDLAARIEISVKDVNSSEFILQKWKLESICIIDNDGT